MQNFKRRKVHIVGVSGGSGSGKTYFCQALSQKLNSQSPTGKKVCELIYQDNFYIDQSKKFDHDGGSVNFDHPDSIDYILLSQSLAKLRESQNIEIPIYEFSTHTRKTESSSVTAVPIILVDGILIFHWPEVRAMLDELIFFETEEDVRYARRLHRDVQERGRTPEGVLQQFERQVKPMHDQFVEPSKEFAHTRITSEEQFSQILDLYFNKLISYCN